MEAAYLLQVVCSLILVIALFGLSSILYKRFVLDKNFMKGGKPRRLAVEEQLFLDSKRRLVLVKKDEEEFLLLLGQNGEIVINGAELQKSTTAKKRLRIKNIYPRKKS